MKKILVASLFLFSGVGYGETIRFLISSPSNLIGTDGVITGKPTSNAPITIVAAQGCSDVVPTGTYSPEHTVFVSNGPAQKLPIFVGSDLQAGTKLSNISSVAFCSPNGSDFYDVYSADTE